MIYTSCWSVCGSVFCPWVRHKTKWSALFQINTKMILDSPPPIVQLLWKLKGQDHDTKCRSPNSVVNSLIYFKKKTKMSLVGPLSHVESWTVKVQVKEVKLRKSFLAVTAPRIVYEYFTYRLQCSNSRGGCACCALHYSTWLVMHLGRVQQLTGRIGRTIRTT